MGWFANLVDGVKEITASPPFACPRGWGEVTFVSSVWVIPPMGGVDRRCPIGGVSDCSDCGYASNPDAFRLSEHLDELTRLRGDGALSETEFDTRRTALLRLHPEGLRRKQLTTAWILGPLGGLVTVAGVVLAGTVHVGFWGMAGFGGAMLALALSFFMLSRVD